METHIITALEPLWVRTSHVPYPDADHTPVTETDRETVSVADDLFARQAEYGCTCGKGFEDWDAAMSHAQDVLDRIPSKEEFIANLEDELAEQIEAEA